MGLFGIKWNPLKDAKKIGGNVVKTVAKAGGDIGRETGKALDNPLVKGLVAAGLTATGVGAPAAAALMGGTHALAKKAGGEDWGSSLATGAKTGVTTYGAGKLLGKVPGLDPLKSRAQNLLGGIPGMDTLRSVGGGARDLVKRITPDSIEGMVAGGGADGQGNFGKLGDAFGGANKLLGGGNPNDKGLVQNLKDEAGRVVRRVAGGQSPIDTTPGAAGTPMMGGGAGGGGMGFLDQLLMGGTIAAGTMDALEKKKLRDRAIGYSTDSYTARAPLRERALKLLGTEQPRESMSSLFADPGNVYDLAARARGGV
jgi:hypothetical protein